MDLAIILVAAGESRRMGFPKLWTSVGGQPLVAYALAAARAAQPSQLIVVVSADRLTEARALAPGAQVVAGGARRRDSVAAGLAAASGQWVAIHDAARAFAPAELFERGLIAARACGAAVPGISLKDTIKRVTDDHVSATLVRDEHVAVQTPQVFRRDLVQRALALTDDDVTDEAALVEQLGIQVAVFPGAERAFKITTPLDFTLARALLASEGQTATPAAPRVRQ